LFLSFSAGLQLLSQAHIQILLLLGIVLNEEGGFAANSATDIVLSILLFMALGLLLVIIGYHLFLVIKKVVRYRQRMQRQQKLKEFEASSSSAALFLVSLLVLSSLTPLLLRLCIFRRRPSRVPILPRISRC
jgi:hypothetical protein